MVLHPVKLENIPFNRLVHPPNGGRAYVVGLKNQRGGGLGAFLGHIVAMIPQFLASDVGKQLVSAGKDVIGNLKEGKDIKTALKKSGRKVVRNLTGLGRKRRSKRRKNTVVLEGLGKRKRRRSKSSKRSSKRKKTINRRPIGIVTNRIAKRKRKSSSKRRHII